MYDPKTLPKDCEIAHALLEHDTAHKQLDLGLLGKLFGSSEHAPLYIAGFVIIALVMIGGMYTVIRIFSTTPQTDTSCTTVEFWKILSPLITATLGFIFGSAVKTGSKQ